MIKKITSKLKSILGRKEKTTVKNTGSSQINEKAKNKPGPRSKKISSSPTSKLKPGTKPNPKKKNFKKETPEEYRLRKEKNAKSKNSSAVPEAKSAAVTKEWDESVFKVESAEGKTRFHDLDLSKEILHSVFDLGFEYCTNVQAEVLPEALKGNDITAQAQTGTGKTAAFLITIFNIIKNNPIKGKRKTGTPRALILAPTRELVLQIEKDAKGLGKYIDASILSILGGMDYRKQQNTLKFKTCDILICTPGRLIDFMDKRIVDLRNVEVLVIDEADRMLDMGFIPAVKKIVASTPAKASRQTMFFSATLTGDVKRLAESWTKNASEIIIKDDKENEPNIEQITYITTLDEKPTLLYNIIMHKKLERVLVFVNRKVDAKRLKEKFDAYGISCALLSGDIEQNQRIKRLEKFREGNIRVLVATNVASRGIHVEAISHVINYNMPQDVEEYVHRIGRTGRAGAAGISISFADEDDGYEIQKLEEYLGKKIEFSYPEEDLLVPIPEEHRNIPRKKTVKKYPAKKSNRKPRKR